MRNTRVMTWIFLVLSAAFFFVRDFRSALKLAVMEVELRSVKELDFNAWTARLRTFGVQQDQLRSLAERADRSGDADGLAYAALHLDDDREAFRAADKAVTLNPKFSWLGYDLLAQHRGSPSAWLRGESDQWIARLEASDPQNAMSWIVAADELAARDGHFPRIKWNSGVPDPSPLVTATDWLAAMQKAFSQPHFRLPDKERFLLERSVLQREGWDTAPQFLGTASAENVTNLLNLRTYANYKCFYLAPRAKSESERLRQYRETSAFGRLMAHESGTSLGLLVGSAIDQIGGQELAKRLETTGSKVEAEQVRQGLLEVRDTIALYGTYSLHRPSTNAVWARVLYPTLTALIATFAALSLLCVLFVQVKAARNTRPGGHIYQVATIGQNYFPILLFTTCVGLFVVNCPYANNFHYYMTVPDPTPVLNVIFTDTFPLHVLLFDDESIPLHTGLRSFGIAAAIGLALLVAGTLLARSRQGRARRASA